MNVEIFAGFRPRPKATHVLFDLDGTLSLIRGGWNNIMVDMFMEQIPRKKGETEEQLRAMLVDDTLRLNGKPSIYQMIRFGERMQERGGKTINPQAAEDQFIQRLQSVALQREADVASGKRTLESVLVPGALTMLDLLKERGLHLFLASGTTEDIVLPEVEQMGLRRYFGEHVYATPVGEQNFSKAEIIEKILSQGVNPEQLIAFGDGFVEIHETSRRGGLAIAVASDEAHPGSGKMDLVKRNLLKEVGAHLAIADYSDAQQLINLIFSTIS